MLTGRRTDRQELSARNGGRFVYRSDAGHKSDALGNKRKILAVPKEFFISSDSDAPESRDQLHPRAAAGYIECSIPNRLNNWGLTFRRWLQALKKSRGV